MSSQEAQELLAATLADLRGRAYDQLRGLLHRIDTSQVTGPSGTRYRIDTLAIEVEHQRGWLHVVVMVGRSDAPGSGSDAATPDADELTGSFIVAPDDSLADE